MATARPAVAGPSLVARIGRFDVAGPVLIVALVLAAVIGLRFHTYHGNATGFIAFGELSVRQTQPPPGAQVNSIHGYDAQYIWIQAKDPLLLHDATVSNLRDAGSAFRLQRVGYPLLAYVLAAGQRGAIPWSFLALNVLVIVGITAAFALYARRGGWSGWWALAIGLMPGFVLSTMRDLSDPLAVASMLAGLLMWRRGRRWWAAGFLTIAVLTREPMAFAVIAVAADAVAQWWRSRDESGSLARVVRLAWPAVVVPALAFITWEVYVDIRYGGNAAATSPEFLPPFKGLIDEVRHAVHRSPRTTAWDLTYIGLMLAGAVAALALLRRRVGAASAAASLFGLSLLVLLFGDQWSYTRLSAPLFAALLLAGLEQRSRFAVWTCTLATALTALIPLAFSVSGAV